MDNNLLVSLRKWVRRQDENFLTEAFAHLLRHLGSHEPNVAVAILKSLSNISLTAKDMEGMAVVTQATTENGRPDITISTPGRFFALLEVKVEAGLGETQLTRYQKDLQASPVPGEAKALILLTQYSPDLPDKEKAQVICRRWHEVAEWLQSHKDRVRDKVSCYLIDQFIGFLKARNISMDPVTKELLGGVRPLFALMTMLKEALQRAQVRKRLKSYRVFVDVEGFVGFSVDGQEYYFGIDTDVPDAISFATGKPAIREDAAEEARCGHVSDDQWINELDLNADNGSFFALSEGEQMQRIEVFLGRCLDALPKVKARGRT